MATTQTTQQPQQQTPAPAPRAAEPADWAQHDADLSNEQDLREWELRREIGAVR